jgi:amino acid adenylation domain-containing protein
MLVQDFLQDSARHFPQKTALVCEGERWTYAQLESMANRLANGFLKFGLKRSERVGIWLGNTLEAVVSIFATLKAGGVFVPLFPGLKFEKLSYILNNCQAVGVVADGKRLSQQSSSQITNLVSGLKFSVVCRPESLGPVDSDANCLQFSEIQSKCSESSPTSDNIDLDLACLVYTSGSTGEPKGVMCDHSNIVFAASSIIQYLENVEQDIILNVLPLSFDYGLYQLLMTFKFGGTLVLENSFAFPASIVEKLEQEHVTGFPGVPTIFAMLLDLELDPSRLSNLRYLTNTAAALSVSQVQKIRETFYWAKLYSMYGLTETKRTLYLPPEQLERRPGSVGIAIPGTEVWIEDAEGIRLGPGITGELVVRGRHVMRGYWGDPELSAKRFRPGPVPGERLCYTGDLFRADDEGYLYFVGRTDEIIKSRGEKISPKEIENVLCALEGVKEAAVIGVPDPLLGQAVKAFVAVNSERVTESSLLAHCRVHLEDLMVPREIEFVEALPRTSSGKVDKLLLAKKHDDQTTAGVQART